MRLCRLLETAKHGIANNLFKVCDPRRALPTAGLLLTMFPTDPPKTLGVDSIACFARLDSDSSSLERSAWNLWTGLVQ